MICVAASTFQNDSPRLKSLNLSPEWHQPDAIKPGPVETDYPTLLDLPSPRLPTYPRETVVLEKLEAMVKLGIANSRMKDFHDLHSLSQTLADGRHPTRHINT